MRSTLSLTRLENRDNPAVSFSIYNGPTLVASGTAVESTVTVAPLAGDVAVNGVDTGVLATDMTRIDLSGVFGDQTYDFGSVTAANFPNLVTVNVAAGVSSDTFLVQSDTTFAMTIDGSNGANDVLSFANANSAVTISFTANNAGMVGNLSFQSIESYVGTSQNDTFALGVGIVATGSINGGGGVDTLSYATWSSAVRANLTTGACTGVFSGVVNIENLTGGNGADILVGSATNNVLTGGGGNNILIGGDGDDSLSCTSGNNILVGGKGSDVLTGGTGDDIFIGGYTSYDNNALNANNYNPFLGIMTEWGRTSVSVATRWSRINGNAIGGLNGSYKLILNSTVFDDGYSDTTIGMGVNDRVIVC